MGAHPPIANWLQIVWLHDIKVHPFQCCSTVVCATEGWLLQALFSAQPKGWLPLQLFRLVGCRCQSMWQTSGPVHEGSVCEKSHICKLRGNDLNTSWMTPPIVISLYVGCLQCESITLYCFMLLDLFCSFTLLQVL